MSKLSDYISLYGVRFALQRVAKSVLLRLFRFSWEKCYLMSRLLDEPIELPRRDGFSVRRVIKNDLMNEQWKPYTDGVLDFLTQCFESDYAEAYGAFVDNHLVYITWVLYNRIDYGGAHIEAPGCAMQWNTFCLASYRGRGMHRYVTAWTLNKMRDCGIHKCYVAIMSYNRPALAVQQKLGLTVERKYYTIHWNNKSYFKGLDISSAPWTSLQN